MAEARPLRSKGGVRKSKEEEETRFQSASLLTADTAEEWGLRNESKSHRNGKRKVSQEEIRHTDPSRISLCSFSFLGIRAEATVTGTE